MSSFPAESSSSSERQASLLKRWKEIEALEEDEENVSEQEFARCKETWFVQAFLFFQGLPLDEHCWCGHYEIAWPLLEPFYSYYQNDSVKILWGRFSQELRKCTRCVLQYYKAKEVYATDFLEDIVSTLLAVLRTLDEERVATHLHDILCKMKSKCLNSALDSEEIICVLFEVMRFPSLLDDAEVDSAFIQFLQYVENTYDLSLAADQCYAGVYALFFHNDQATRRIALRLAGAFGKLRTAVDLEPIQPVLQKHMHCLEFDLFDSKKLSSGKWSGGINYHATESSSVTKDRPRARCTRESLWIGLKTLLGMLEPPAFEEGVVERYPVFLSIVLNHASEASPVFWNALHCLKLLLEVLGYKLWIKTTFSPGVMRSTLIGQCFHTREEKMHKAIFDLFQPFLQSLEALQDGEYERQRRNILYFLLQQVGHSRNFSGLMSKKARQIAFLIILRGFKMDPACAPVECVHVWGPSLLESVKDTLLYDSLRQPAVQLLETIIIADSSVLSYLHSRGSKSKSTSSHQMLESVQEVTESFCQHFEKGDNISYLKDYKSLDNLGDSWNTWLCAPVLWVEILDKVLPSNLPESFSQAVLWASSRLSTVHLKELDSRDMWPSPHPEVGSTNAIASSLVWETPKGCDDGADGKLCPNSLVARNHPTQLVLLLKRCVGTFLGHIPLTIVSGSWIWDPYLAEVLVLLALDNYEKVRDFGRYILAHFAKDPSLDSGLVFLCSSQTSAVCVISGLFYAVKLLMMNSLHESISCLQSLLFLARKVVTCWQRDPFDSSEAPKILNSSAVAGEEGGFLKQPDYNQRLPSETSGISKERDTKREMNLQQVSNLLWPLLLRLLKDGRPYSDDPTYLTLFTRLFDLLPSVFQNILLPLVEVNLFKDLIQRTIRDTGTAWIFHFMSWGDVSILSIHRRWRFAVGSMLTYSSRKNCLEEPKALQQAHDWIETGAALNEEMREKIEMLLRMSLSGAIKNLNSSYLKVEPSNTKVVPYREGEKRTFESNKGIAVLPSRILDVIDLSDDESECLPSDSIMCRTPANRLLKNITAEDQTNLQPHKAPSSQPQKHVHPMSLQKQLGTLRSGLGKKATLDKFFTSSSGTPGGTTEARKNPVTSGISKSDFSKSDISKADAQGSSNKPSSVIIEAVVPEDKVIVQSKGNDPLQKKVVPEDKAIVQSKGNDPLQKKVEENLNESTTERHSEEAQKDILNSVLKELIQDEPKDLHKPAAVNARKGLSLVTNPQPKRQVIQLHVPTEQSKCSIPRFGIAGRPPLPRLDEWYKRILSLDYFSVVGVSSDSTAEGIQAEPMLKVPLVFRSPQHYMDVFRPLVLEEFRAQLQQSYDQLNFADETTTGILCLMSLEKVDDFDVGRFTTEAGADGPARACYENDLMLLSRQPFQSGEHTVYMIGKVERKERDNKNHSVIVILKFYLRSGNKRLAKARTLLVERSKWHTTRLMSITPQLREFQALSAVEYLPLLPIILNDGICKMRPLTTAATIEQCIKGLAEKLQHRLKADYNTSQIRSINMALSSSAKANGHELSLVQGPPGTGKTRTILAIVSALIASMKNTSGFVDTSKSDNLVNANRSVSRSVAIARSWQAAALAKQQMQLEDSENLQKDRDKRIRILVCAQSNAAVDELVSRMCENGLYDTNGGFFRPFVVRVGNAKMVHPNSLPVFIDTLIENRMESDKENTGGSSSSKSNTELIRKKFHKILDNIQALEAKLSKLQNNDAHSKRGAGHDSVSGTDDPEGALKKEVNMLYKQRRQTYAELAALEAAEKRSLEVARSKRLELKRDIIRQAEIVLATLSGCGGDVYSACFDKSGRRRQLRNLDEGLFDAVVIDEAAQALEPATLIPLQLLKSSHAKCVMVGDPKQLPATVISQMASRFSFECSLFERLQKGGHPVSLLSVQYRMHPEICEFPSAHFYENQLEDGKTLLDERKAVFHENNYSGPYVVFDVVEGYETVRHQSTSQSLCNEAEAEMVLEIFRNLRTRYSEEIHPGRIGIITPYQQQLSLLRERFRRILGQSVAEGIEFNTVDGFQGREVDILIFSTVRATSRNAQSSSRIGFVADVRRMNVALTRAKFSLWIVCNAATLQASPPWAALLQNAKERGLLHRVKSPYRSFFENGYCHELRDQSDRDSKRSPAVFSDPMVSNVGLADASKETGKHFIIQESKSLHRPLASSNCLGKIMNLTTVVNAGDHGSDHVVNAETKIEGSLLDEAQRIDSKCVEGFDQITSSGRLEASRDMPLLDPFEQKSSKQAENSLEGGQSELRRSCELLPIVSSCKENKGQTRSHKRLERGRGQCIDSGKLQETDIQRDHRGESVDSKKHTSTGGQSFMKSLHQHTAGTTHSRRKPAESVEQKPSKDVVLGFENRDSVGSSNSRRKIIGPGFDKQKVRTSGTIAIRSNDLGASHGFSSDASFKGLSTGQSVADDASINPPILPEPNEGERKEKFARPLKRSRYDKVAGSAFSTSTQNTEGNSFIDIQVGAAENHANDHVSSSEVLDKEWDQFLHVLNESKVRYPFR